MTISPDLLMQAYAIGAFPMAEARDAADIFWIEPRRRGIIPLDGFHASRSLRRRIRNAPWQVTIDRAFHEVVLGCAARPETWINDEIMTLYRALHARGDAHSLEVWEGDLLAGGVYGVALGGAFFGESMFSARRDASKVALAWLVHRLRAGGFALFDVQFLTPHLASLGGVEITARAYRVRLARAITHRADFAPPGYAPTAMDVAAGI